MKCIWGMHIRLIIILHLCKIMMQNVAKDCKIFAQNYLIIYTYKLIIVIR